MNVIIVRLNQICTQDSDCPADHQCHSTSPSSNIKLCLPDFCDPADLGVTYGNLARGSQEGKGGSKRVKYDINERALLVCSDGLYFFKELNEVLALSI